MSEFALIDAIHARCRTQRHDVVTGIGDDAAVLACPEGRRLVACTDTLVDGVHFPRGTAAEDIGWKSLAVNLSDLAAMGADPAWALLALTLPAADMEFVERFTGGFAELARQHGVDLVGGDLTQGPLSITVTALGFVTSGAALTRAGARAGDAVFVTGTLGDAAAGLHWLRNHAVSTGARGTTITADAPAALLQRLRRPTPRLVAGRALGGIASACIDLSDGLLADLGHVADASGVGIEVDAAALPASPALRVHCNDEERLSCQASGGDDYELAFTVPPDRIDAVVSKLIDVGCAATRIGRVAGNSGVRLCDAAGGTIEPPSRGWEHFR
ncbi:MAG: thiamine-phosphate kinase [Lysobacterales bacterium]